MDSRQNSTVSRPRPRAWPIAGGIALTVLAGVLMTMPHLAQAEPRGAAGRHGDRRGLDPDPISVPDAGATDQPSVSGTSAATSRPEVTGFVQLLPDVAIKCFADRGRHENGRSDPRLLCTEVRPHGRRGPHRGRALDGFWR